MKRIQQNYTDHMLEPSWKQRTGSKTLSKKEGLTPKIQTWHGESIPEAESLQDYILGPKSVASIQYFENQARFCFSW